MVLRIIICDSSRDDLYNIEQTIRKTIEASGYDAKIALTTGIPEKVIEYLAVEQGISLYMLDVQYSKHMFDGIEIAKQIRNHDRDSYIVFITSCAHSIQIVMKGLIRPAGFFIKPVETGDIEILLGDIYRDFLNIEGVGSYIFNVNIGSTIYRIEYDQILYFEAFQKKVYIHTSNQRIGYYDSLSSLESRLGEQFIRCHKSYIINKDKVLRIDFSDNRIVMENGAEIDISRTYKHGIKENLKAM